MFARKYHVRTSAHDRMGSSDRLNTVTAAKGKQKKKFISSLLWVITYFVLYMPLVQFKSDINLVTIFVYFSNF